MEQTLNKIEVLLSAYKVLKNENKIDESQKVLERLMELIKIL